MTKIAQGRSDASWPYTPIFFYKRRLFGPPWMRLRIYNSIGLKMCAVATDKTVADKKANMLVPPGHTPQRKRITSWPVDRRRRTWHFNAKLFRFIFYPFRDIPPNLLFRSEYENRWASSFRLAPQWQSNRPNVAHAHLFIDIIPSEQPQNEVIWRRHDTFLEHS